MRRWLPRRRLAAAACAAVVSTGLWIRCGPLPQGLLLEDAGSTVIVDRHGEPLYEARSDSGMRAETLSASELPPVLVHATLAAEDVRFRAHIGLDPISLVRAAVHDLRARRVVEGGSTITQQAAKLLLAHDDARPRGWWTKLNEAVVALRLEHRLDKDEILALYLNLAPYGNQVQGAARAARAYFGRSPADLTPAEAAFLAALPQQPTRFNPWRSPDGARARQLRILAIMQAHGWLSPADAAGATAERLVLSHDRPASIAPHFVDRVLAAADGAHPRRIQTTLDATLQRAVQGIIEAQRGALVEHHAANVAVAVLDNRTGDWLAWEGSGNYFDGAHGGTIDGVISPRQPGSALKPFIYAAAFERGGHPGELLADVPSQFRTAVPGILYSPRNYDGRFRGPLLARAALAGSENVPAVALADSVGVPAIARLLRAAGFTTLTDTADHYGLGLTLGNAEVRLDELVAAYAMLARGGERVSPRMILSMDGRAPQAPPAAVDRVVSMRTAFWIADVLSDAEARAYIFGRGGSLEFPFTVAAKTGTSQSYFDNWTVGYTRDVTVGVWVGNFDRTPLRGSSGVTGAGPIFHAVMIAAVERVRGSLPIGEAAPLIAPPADVRRVELCAESGMAAGDACPTRVSEWLPAELTPERCTWHHASDEGLVTVWPAAFQDWARTAGVASATTLAAGPPAGPAPMAVATSSPRPASPSPRGLTIVRPLAGALFLLDPTLRPEFQALTFSARNGSSDRLEWFVDGAAAGVETGEARVQWPLERGRHRVSVTDAAGETASVMIDVR